MPLGISRLEKNLVITIFMKYRRSIIFTYILLFKQWVQMSEIIKAYGLIGSDIS